MPVPLVRAYAFVVIAATGAGQSHAGSRNQIEPSPCWELVAASDALIVGRFESLRNPQGDPIAHVERVLKGALGGRTSLEVFSHSESPAFVANRSYVLFLVKPSAKGPYYVTGSSPDLCPATAPASAELIDELVEEIERQRTAVSDFSRISARVSRDPMTVTIKNTIDAMVRGDEDDKADAFARLLGLGPEAIPSLVVLIDDERPLPGGLVEVPIRSPASFESLAHYNPETVLDALDLVLTHLTGFSFASLDKGLPDAHRRIIAAWKVYLSYHSP